MSECKFKIYALSQQKKVIRRHPFSGQKKASPEEGIPGKNDKNRLISHYPAAMRRDIFILPLSRSLIDKRITLPWLLPFLHVTLQTGRFFQVVSYR
ncbi:MULTISPECIES: hypothetical protein [unclassified Pantoea]|uniref:hypothetical protein n=1 Tax=unclassified Pantoea TaxID=2630326 RepID=UPI00226993CD|nr:MULTISPECIES: hypothetical protein [unclassified Pantoea]